MAERSRGFSGVPFDPIREGSILMTYLPPKAPPLNTITLGVKISTYEFGRDTNIQSITTKEQILPWRLQKEPALITP